MRAAESNPQMRKLEQRLRVRFPRVPIDVDPPAETDGTWFLDVAVGKHTVSVQWQRGSKGFGITSSPDLAYGEGAHEIVRGAEAAFERIVQLILARGRTRAPDPIRLGDIRRLLGVSQEQLAAALHIKPSSVSKLEQRDDWKLSSLRAMVEGLGGKRNVRASFPDGRSHLLDIAPTRAKR